MDIYSTRAQLAAIEILPREYPFLQDAFARDAGVVEDNKAIYDFRKGTKVMAPVVVDAAGGVVMNRGGFETREIGFATIAPERIIENSDLQGRMFGEKVLGAMTPEEREKKVQAKDLTEMLAAIDRRIGWMVRQVLLTGRLELFRYTNEGRDLLPTVVADYGFTNFYTPDNLWGSGSADIAYDLEKIYDLVYDGCGEVEKIVMAPNVWAAMRGNSKFTQTLDLKNADMGELRTKYRGQGLRFLGWNSDGVELYTLSGTFINDAGTAEKLIPDGKLIAGGADLLNIFYGPVTQVEQEDAAAEHKTYMKKVVPLRYGSIESNAIKNRLTSRPTIVPKNVDGWAVATVLGS